MNIVGYVLLGVLAFVFLLVVIDTLVWVTTRGKHSIDDNPFSNEVKRMWNVVFK